jgi:hypothetical protein
MSKLASHSRWIILQFRREEKTNLVLFGVKRKGSPLALLPVKLHE